jgi:hypothetical protein
MFSYKLSSSAEIGSLIHAVWQPQELSSWEVKISREKKLRFSSVKLRSNALTYRKTS